MNYLLYFLLSAATHAEDLNYDCLVKCQLRKQTLKQCEPQCPIKKKVKNAKSHRAA